MTQTIVALGGLALLDSLNPSALVVTIYLLTRERPAPAVAAYLAGIFVTYTAIGIILMLGLDVLLTTFQQALWGPAAYGLRGAVGIGLLLYIGMRPRPGRDGNGPGTDLDTASIGTDFETARRPPFVPKSARVAGWAGLFALGAVVTLFELTTAMPYMAAIGLLTYLQWPVAQWVGALVAYNVVFILPPLVLLGVSVVWGARFRPRLAAWRNRIERSRRGWGITGWLVGIIGLLLVLDALTYFDFFGLWRLRWPGGAESMSEFLLRDVLP